MEVELKKKSNKKLSLIIGILLVLIVTISISYSIFKYSKTTDNQQLIAGDIYMKAIGNEVTVGNIKPMDKEEGKVNGNKYKFKVEGYNNSKKDIYYGIYLNHGEEIENKERFNDEDIVVYLTETKNGETKDVFGPGRLSDFNRNMIYSNTISGNIEKEDKVEIEYELTVWLSDNVLVSDTETSFEGRSIYTTSEYENSYFNIDVEVEGDFVEKEIVKGNVEIEAHTVNSNEDYDLESAPVVGEEVEVIIKSDKETNEMVVTDETTSEVDNIEPIKKNGIWEGHYIAESSGKYNYYVVYTDGKISPRENFAIKIEYKYLTKPNNKLCISRVYNGESQELVENNKEGYTFTNYQGKDAGSYQITAKLKSGYRWNDESKTEVKFNCNIGKKDIIVTPDSNQSKVYGTEDKDLTYTYTGNIEEPGFIGKLGRTPGNDVGSYAINKGTLDIEDKGEFKKSNYNLKLSETTVYFKITKSSPKLTLTEASGEVVSGRSIKTTVSVEPQLEGSYTATSNQLGIANASVSENEITINGVSSGNAKITITFNPKDNKNYNPASIDYTIVVDKVASEASCLNPTYNGVSQNLASGGVGITLGSNTGINASDSYQVTETLQEGYRWSDNTTGTKTLTCKINKRDTTVTANHQTITYGSKIDTAVTKATASDLPTGHSLSEVTLSTTATNVPGGKITASNAKISASGTDVTSNYNISYAEGTLTINKANVGTGSCKTGLIYTGGSQELVDKIGGVTYTDTTGIDAKSYNITVTPDSNHKFSDNAANKPLSCSIGKKSVTLTWNVGSYTYNGSNQGPSATVASGAISGETLTIETTKQTNAGTNITSTASVTGVSGGRANKDNYTISNPTQTYTIAKANPVVTLTPTTGTILAGTTITFTESANLKGKFGNASNAVGIATATPATTNVVEANTNQTITVTGTGKGETNIVVTFTPSDTTNYNNKTENYKIIVNLVDYTINYYLMRQDKRNYDLGKTVTKGGKVGENVTGELLTFDNQAAPASISKVLTATASQNVIDYYYTRTCYGIKCEYLARDKKFGEGLYNKKSELGLYNSGLSGDTSKQTVRYTGTTSEEPENYVCFGAPTREDCFKRVYSTYTVVEDENTYFDGVNDYMNLGYANQNFGNKVSIVARVKFHGQRGGIVANVQYGGIGLANDDSTSKQIKFLIYINGSYRNLYSNKIYSENVWYTIVATYNGSVMNLYIDGVLDNQKTQTGTIQKSAQPLTLAADPQPNNAHRSYANFTLSDVFVYTDEITADEVAKYFSGEIYDYPTDNALITTESYRAIRDKATYTPSSYLHRVVGVYETNHQARLMRVNSPGSSKFASATAVNYDASTLKTTVNNNSSLYTGSNISDGVPWYDVIKDTPHGIVTLDNLNTLSANDILVKENGTTSTNKLWPLTTSDLLLSTGNNAFKFVNDYATIKTSWLYKSQEWGYHKWNNDYGYYISETGALCGNITTTATNYTQNCGTGAAGNYGNSKAYRLFFNTNENLLFCGGSGTKTDPMIIGYNKCVW